MIKRPRGQLGFRGVWVSFSGIGRVGSAGFTGFGTGVADYICNPRVAIRRSLLIEVYNIILNLNL